MESFTVTLRDGTVKTFHHYASATHLVIGRKKDSIRIHPTTDKNVVNRLVSLANQGYKSVAYPIVNNTVTEDQ